MVLVGGKSSPLIDKKIINQQSIRSGLLSTKINLQYLVWIYYLFLTFAFVTQKGIPILTVIDKRIIIFKEHECVYTISVREKVGKFKSKRDTPFTSRCQVERDGGMSFVIYGEAH